MWTVPFERVLRRLIRDGDLRVRIGNGPEMCFGNGLGPGSSSI